MSRAWGSDSKRSAAAVLAAEPSEPLVDCVQLDGLVVLKIIKHCRESLPTFVAGSLLGLDVESTLEVTNCFPFPSSSDEAGEEIGGVDYQMEMMKSLENMNADNNQVGWYQSTYLGTFCTADLVSTQFDFQESIGPNAVVVTYDPLGTTHGSLPLRAFRLTSKFMKAYKANKFILPESIEGAPVASSGIFEEIPVKVANPPLARALLFDLEESTKAISEVDFDRLDLSANPVLEKKMQFLLEQVDDLSSWSHNAGFWERRLFYQKQQQEQWLAKRKAENAARKEAGQALLPEKDMSLPFFKPLTDAKNVDRLDALLISARIGTYCDEINEFAGQSFSKLFLAGRLRGAGGATATAGAAAAAASRTA